MVMSRARVVACIIVVVVVVTWYAITFQHLLLGSRLQPTTTTTTTTTTNTTTSSHQRVFGSDLHTQRPTSNMGQTYHASDFMLTGPQNYSLEVWKSIMQRRVARVARVCQQHPQALHRFDTFSVFKSLTVDPAHHLVYCRNAKAGTTAWLSRLLRWSGITLTNTSTTVTDVHTLADQTFPLLAPQKTLQQLQSSSLTFTVARHPFTRLVSAYRNKIEKNYKSERWSEMLRKYRKNPNNKTETSDTRPTFREFVLFASDEVMRCLGQTRPSCLQDVDVHWLPHHDRCAPCDIKYNVIAKMETKDEDEAYISHLLGLPLPPPTQRNAALGSSTASLTKTLFSTLTASERKHVFKAYQFDFLMFNYTYNDEDYS